MPYSLQSCSLSICSSRPNWIIRSVAAWFPPQSCLWEQLSSRGKAGEKEQLSLIPHHCSLCVMQPFLSHELLSLLEQVGAPRSKFMQVAAFSEPYTINSRWSCFSLILLWLRTIYKSRLLIKSWELGIPAVLPFHVCHGVHVQQKKPGLTNPALRKLSVSNTNTTNFPTLGGHKAHYSWRNSHFQR